ncbi:NAD(P)/FAD-dependent oxidoreductase [Corallococcus carmarthensis]|uniref:NAD(P)/FAD-dependent oxidoreductase n=1 Tax=Corallococcus carmarthensis TaxID=2316728 RepID=A0A3A8K0E9_9BACT|nr:NAD(P)/FAD-dependent oxidoreductase [Corallococcus carmarthensis]NOK20069.1 NAD(P)/FAD-dependent oxidoreductase [Corallococcus carmarthensis]RKG97934.1 NAD(P)/FAD-dependent oxidoreductase [Corallococcus carmarthensis]
MDGIRYDVAVLGGGPAGAALSLALRRHSGLRVALFERSTYAQPHLGETLPPDSRRLLAQLGVWEAFARQGHLRSMGSCSRWGASSLGYNDHLRSPWGTGWHLDRARFDRMLADEATRHGVDVRTGTAVTEWKALEDGGHRLFLPVEGDAPRAFVDARFVVDATGRSATFATSQGARRHTVDRAFGLCGTFALQPGRTVDALTLVEACEDGWWYSARMPGDQVVFGLMGDRDSLQGLLPKDAEAWRARMARAPETLGRLEACAFTGEPLRAVPANVACLDLLHGEDWLAVGDAAFTLDPLSSQGTSQALRSAHQAADAVSRYLRGDFTALRLHEVRVRHQFQEHLRIREGYYRLERRWPSAPYWRNRQQSHAPLPFAAASNPLSVGKNA